MKLKIYINGKAFLIMNWKTQYIVKMVTVTKLMYKLNGLPIKTPAAFFGGGGWY